MIRKYLADCWSTLIVYWFCVAVFALFCVLYDLKFSLIVDFVRFTWLVAVGAAFFKTVRTFRILRRIENGNIDESFGRTLVEREFLRKLSEEKDNLNQRAQKLEQEFKERYDYLIVWSHEMKTPLTALKLMADAADVVDSARVQKQVDNAEYQLNLLLNYERLSDFNHDIEFVSIDLLELVQQILRENMTFFVDKNLTLDVAVPHKKILTDKKWMSFILEQILVNASKYSAPHQQIMIGYDDGVLFIQDEGIGISQSDLPKIFEAGFTGENGRKHGAATGMGLYIVKRVSEFLKIDVAVDSKLGAGTVVRLDLNRILDL